ncbi:YgaP family membrane protein [Chitinophaga sp. 22620]|uniref:YgaP family membrane protein n=1 Tax=Chitinophaga sp. 22620 TaxID=3453952 RepID=UPI003F82969A
MKINMGTADRIIRIIIALAIAFLYNAGIIYGAGGIILVVAAVVFFLTAIAGNCPVYSLLGINSLRRKKHPQQ